MKKVLTLFSIVLMTLMLIVSYHFLTKQIIAGSSKITAGQKQLAEGEQALAKGKIRLSNGKRELSQVKDGYKDVKTASIAVMTTLPLAGEMFALASNKLISNKIAEEDRLVANGAVKIKRGEEQVNTGKVELRQGMELLNLAKVLRIICAIGVIFLSALLIVLGFYWRQTLLGFLKRVN